MISVFVRAAFFAIVLFGIIAPARAQALGPVTQDPGDYKPPSRLTAKPSAQTGEAKRFAPAGEKAAPQAGLKTIGLISGIGDSFTVKRVGITVFGNEEDQFPIAAWKVNDRVAATVAGLLKKNFRVRRIAASQNDFASLHERGLLFRDQDEDYTAVVKRLAAGQPADFYLVITPTASQFGGTNQSMSGLGVTRADSVFGGVDYVHALCVLRVYDGQFKRLRWEATTTGQDGFMAAVKGPHVQITEAAQRLPKDPCAAFNDPRARQLTLDLL
jgi:hypothetical protein